MTNGNEHTVFRGTLILPAENSGKVQKCPLNTNLGVNMFCDEMHTKDESIQNR